MAYNINDFSPVCGMIHLNMVPEEMEFVLCSETGNVINWYWISGAQANGGRDQMGLLEQEGGGPRREMTGHPWTVSPVKALHL